MYIIYKYHIADITKATQEEELNYQININIFHTFEIYQ